jgi:NAD(P)-dependent dehydrogenase (short-subunit alcohol dehydrogenase family)
MDKPLTGQVAFITGASGGLGLHFARVLAEAGAAIALTARRTSQIEDEAEALRAKGYRAQALTLDVADAAAIAPAMDAIEASLGPISILINNAGVGGEGLALDVSVEVWDQTYAVNVRGVFLCAREAARRMIASGVAARGDARIVNIASIGGHSVLPGLTAYCSSKAAVEMMTRSLAREWARPGIAVNAMCPGFIETDINAHWFKTEGGERQLKGFPRRRLMESTDLDAALLMLSGPAARAITGSVITLDDGQTL